MGAGAEDGVKVPAGGAWEGAAVGFGPGGGAGAEPEGAWPPGPPAPPGKPVGNEPPGKEPVGCGKLPLNEPEW